MLSSRSGRRSYEEDPRKECGVKSGKGIELLRSVEIVSERKKCSCAQVSFLSNFVECEGKMSFDLLRSPCQPLSCCFFPLTNFQEKCRPPC
jgi:hypothetical protein